MPTPEYACPHLDAVIDMIKYCLPNPKVRLGQLTFDEIDETYNDFQNLADSDWEDRLEKVREICEILREQKGQAEDRVEELQTQVECLEEEISDLRREISELQANIHPGQITNTTTFSGVR